MEALSSSNGQVPSLSLFGQPDEAREAKGWDEAEVLKNEKEALGFYISGNPLSKYRNTMRLLDIKGISELEDVDDKKEITAAGIISGLKRLRTRNKAETMAYLALEDEEGTVEVIVFPELYKAHANLLKKDTPLLVQGTVDRTEKGIKVVARELSGLDDLIRKGNGRKVEISITGENPDLKALKELLMGNAGSMPLYLRIRSSDAETLIQTSYGIQPDALLADRVETVFGKGAFRVI